MSRNSSGTYSLPAGNPVVTGTTITSSWANTTLTDIANALTDSLSRTGQGGMSAGLPLFDGTGALPGLAWATELTSGMYRFGAGDYRWVITTTELLQLTSNLVRFSGTAPIFRFFETDGSTNNKFWDIIVSGEDMNFRVMTDALVATNWLTITRTGGTVDSIVAAATAITLTSSVVTVSGEASFTNSGGPGIIIARASAPSMRISQTDAASNEKIWDFAAIGGQLSFRALNDAASSTTTWLAVDRTGTTIDTVNFPSGTLQYGGVEVGFRGLPAAASAGTYAFAATDRGFLIEYVGPGGSTFNINNGVFSGSEVITVTNAGSGNLTISGTIGTLSWFNGSGTISTGGRTLAVGGVATVYLRSSTAAYIWGTGIS